MEITIFRKEDIKADGFTFKKKNNVRVMLEYTFMNYLKENNLTISKGYIDDKGFISNGEMFKCNANGFIVGVTSIINRFNGVE